MKGVSRRLLIVSRAAEPRGGADRIVVDLCRELPRRGWDVTLGLTRGARFDDPDRYREVYGDLPIVEIDGRLGTRHSRVKAIQSAIQETGPDVVLVMRVFDALVAATLLKRAGLDFRLAFGIRSYEPEYLCDAIHFRDSIDLCVTSGELIADACRELCGFDADRVISIGGGIHPPRKPQAIRTPRSPIRLLYAGRIAQEQKRILDVTGFLEELERREIDYHLQIAGSGPEEQALRSQLQKRIDRGTVQMHGWVDGADLYNRFYPEADVFLHFAAWEGVTIAPREAMAHGVVPVISRFRGLQSERQFVDGETALTFPVGDVSAAADRIEQLIHEPELMTQLSASAMRSQSGKYSFDGAIASWNDEFRKAINRPMRVGRTPQIPDRSRGRLAKCGLPSALEDLVRNVARRPVQHHSPGSEWPTSSGLMTRDDRLRFEQFADQKEAGEEIERSAGAVPS